MRIPSLGTPKFLPHTLAERRFIQNERLERCGLVRLAKENKRKDLRICTSHDLDVVDRTVMYDSPDGPKSHRFKFSAPIQTGPKSFTNSTSPTLNKGSAYVKHWGGSRAIGKDVAAEEEFGDINAVNETVAKIIDIEKPVDTSPVKKRKFFQYQKKTPDPKPSIFLLQDLSPDGINRRTGFSDLFCLLLYITTVCGGDMIAISNTCSTLTWLEEWMLYFEYIYGRTRTRLRDYSAEYKLSRSLLQCVTYSKLVICVKARNRWPMYLSHKEDCKFRQRQWDMHFENKRVVMHDNTNINLVKPQSADKQRSLHSEYYGGSCAKGGVGVQLSGWIRTLHLLTGGIDDSGYIDLVKILKQQKLFQELDREALAAIIEFINILDKGYCSTILARDHNQSCLQPTFAKSDEQFTGSQILHSAAITVVRSGNERAVKRVKDSWIIQRGIHSATYDLSRLDDIWLAWGFQVNFVYNTVL